jgi:hypothetical protein
MVQVRICCNTIFFDLFVVDASGFSKDGSLSSTDEGLGKIFWERVWQKVRSKKPKIFGERVWVESQIEENLPW